MNKEKLTLYSLAILFGLFMIIFGGIDDSPGGQMLGLILTIIGFVGIFRNRKKLF